MCMQVIKPQACLRPVLSLTFLMIVSGLNIQFEYGVKWKTLGCGIHAVATQSPPKLCFRQSKSTDGKDLLHISCQLSHLEICAILRPGGCWLAVFVLSQHVLSCLGTVGLCHYHGGVFSRQSLWTDDFFSYFALTDLVLFKWKFSNVSQSHSITTTLDVVVIQQHIHLLCHSTLRLGKWRTANLFVMQIHCVKCAFVPTSECQDISGNGTMSAFVTAAHPSPVLPV